MVWNRIILPDMSSLTLDKLAGTDPVGYAESENDVDYHWGRIFAGAALTTLLGVGAEPTVPENWQGGNRIVIAGHDSAQYSINQVYQEMTWTCVVVDVCVVTDVDVEVVCKMTETAAAARKSAVLRSAGMSICEFTAAVLRRCHPSISSVVTRTP